MLDINDTTYLYIKVLLNHTHFIDSREVFLLLPLRVPQDSLRKIYNFYLPIIFISYFPLAMRVKTVKIL